MTIILFVLLSIWVLAALSWRVGTVLNRTICPVCVGVCGTWIALLILRGFGVAVDPIILGTLMGGSVVGIAYTCEKRLATGRSLILWKLLFIPFGFLFAASVIEQSAAGIALGVIALLFISYLYLGVPKKVSQKPDTGAIENKLKNCC